MGMSRVEQELSGHVVKMCHDFYRRKDTQEFGYVKKDPELNALYHATFIVLSIESMNRLAQLCIKYEKMIAK